jgi:hypothetical protein
MYFKQRWYGFLYDWLDPKNTEDSSTAYEWRELRRELRWRDDVRAFTRENRTDRYVRAAAEDFWRALKGCL